MSKAPGKIVFIISIAAVAVGGFFGGKLLHNFYPTLYSSQLSPEQKKLNQQQKNMDKLVALRNEAIPVCQKFIKRDMNDPDSAKFDREGIITFPYLNGEVTVEQPMRGKNGFGALVKQNMICVLQKNGDKWSLVNMYPTGDF